MIATKIELLSRNKYGPLKLKPVVKTAATCLVYKQSAVFLLPFLCCHLHYGQAC